MALDRTNKAMYISLPTYFFLGFTARTTSEIQSFFSESKNTKLHPT